MQIAEVIFDWIKRWAASQFQASNTRRINEIERIVINDRKITNDEFNVFSFFFFQFPTPHKFQPLRLLCIIQHSVVVHTPSALLWHRYNGALKWFNWREHMWPVRHTLKHKQTNKSVNGLTPTLFLINKQATFRCNGTSANFCAAPRNQITKAKS